MKKLKNIKGFIRILKTQNNDLIVKKTKFENFKKYINNIFNYYYGNFLNIENKNANDTITTKPYSSIIQMIKMKMKFILLIIVQTIFCI